MQIDDRIRHCVVFIGHPTEKGFEAYGTGFLVATVIEGLIFQQIVTARHVIDDFSGDEVYIRVNKKIGPLEEIQSRKSDWIPHPDKSVDISVCPCSLPNNVYDVLSIHLEKDGLDETKIRDHGITVGADVFIAGVYVSRIGELRNIPVVRCGTIAAMAEEPIWPGSKKRPAYLIEVRSLAGISGSPVYVQVPVWIRVGAEIQQHLGDYQFLLGVVLGHHVRMGDVDKLPVEEREVVEEEKTEFNTGLAVVVPINQVAEAIDQPLIREKREQIVIGNKKESGYRQDSAHPSITKVRDETLRTMLPTSPRPRTKSAKKRVKNK